MSSSGTTGNIH